MGPQFSGRNPLLKLLESKQTGPGEERSRGGGPDCPSCRLVTTLHGEIGPLVLRPEDLLLGTWNVGCQVESFYQGIDLWHLEELTQFIGHIVKIFVCG